MNTDSYNNQTLPNVLWRHRIRFTLIATTISFVTFTLLFFLGFVPEELSGNNGSDIPSLKLEVAETSPVEKRGEEPVRVIAESIGLDTTIQNPTSTNIEVLDATLKKGAVRYPDSGTLGSGNMFLFGHSSYLPVVNNQAFRAFNEIQKLAEGEEIKIRSYDREYIYKVTNVYLADAEEAFVDLSGSKNMLTLSTCNSFGEPQERYVVEADYVRSRALY